MTQKNNLKTPMNGTKGGHFVKEIYSVSFKNYSANLFGM